MVLCLDGGSFWYACSLSNLVNFGKWKMLSPSSWFDYWPWGYKAVHHSLARVKYRNADYHWKNQIPLLYLDGPSSLIAITKQRLNLSLNGLNSISL